MSRSTWTLLALLGLSLAWAAWAGRPDARSAGAPAQALRVWDVPVQAVRGLTYGEGSVRIALEAQGAPADPLATVWVRFRSGGAQAADAGATVRPALGDPLARSQAFARLVHQEQAPAGAAPRGRAPQAALAPATLDESFRGSATAVQALRDLASPVATRDLGAAPALHLDQFGLAPAQGQVELRRAQGQPLHLLLGMVSSGNLGRYVLSGQDQHVYLAVAQFLRYPPQPRVLLDRELLAFPPWQSQRIVVAQGARRATLWRLPTRMGSAAEWGPRADASQGSREDQDFVAQLMSLTVQGYQSAEVIPPREEALAPQRALLAVEMFRAAPQAPPGAAPLPEHGPAAESAWLRVYPAQGGKVWAVSSYTERPVWLPGAPAQALLRQGQTLILSASKGSAAAGGTLPGR